MGQASSQSNPKGKKVVQSKIDTATKTGVLNLSAQDLKPTSAPWARLSDTVMVTKITSLDVSRNPKLNELPPQITLLSSLKHLIVSSCDISILPDLSGLSSLTNLKADHNCLTFATVQGLPAHLSKLDLSHNKLVSIPPSFSSLTNVSVLNLSFNQLPDIRGIAALVNLAELFLDNNELQALPVELAQCRKLHILSLKFNSIGPQDPASGEQAIPVVVFTRTELKSLHLQGNPMTQRQALQLDGIDAVLERRRQNKDKLLHGGAMSDGALFGLEER